MSYEIARIVVETDEGRWPKEFRVRLAGWDDQWRNCHDLKEIGEACAELAWEAALELAESCIEAKK